MHVALRSEKEGNSCLQKFCFRNLPPPKDAAAVLHHIPTNLWHKLTSTGIRPISFLSWLVLLELTYVALRATRSSGQARGQVVRLFSANVLSFFVICQGPPLAATWSHHSVLDEGILVGCTRGGRLCVLLPLLLGHPLEDAIISIEVRTSIASLEAFAPIFPEAKLFACLQVSGFPPLNNGAFVFGYCLGSCRRFSRRPCT